MRERTKINNYLKLLKKNETKMINISKNIKRYIIRFISKNSKILYLDKNVNKIHGK